MTLRGTRLQYVYTSEEEISEVFTVEGMNSHIENLISVREYMTGLVERASSIVNQYLFPKYDPESLASHVRIRELATYIAAYKLSIRGGEPELFLYQYNEALETLEAFRDNQLYLDLSTTSRFVPLMQNSIVDNRFAVRPLRVVPHTSTQVRPGQQTSYVPYFGWWY